MSTIWVVLLLSSSPSDAGAPVFGADSEALRPCADLYQRQMLLVQQLRASKACRASTIVDGGTDCVFAVGKTIVRIVGATDFDEKGRSAGLRGTGFYIDAVDPAHRVRAYIPAEQTRLVVEVAQRDARAVKACVYDSAQVHLDGRVSGGGPWGEESTAH